LKKLRREIERRFGFEILVARTEIGGYCAHCQTLREREMRQAARSAAAPRAKKRRPRSK